jgi:hypothetical protein
MIAVGLNNYQFELTREMFWVLKEHVDWNGGCGVTGDDDGDGYPFHTIAWHNIETYKNTEYNE